MYEFLFMWVGTVIGVIVGFILACLFIGGSDDNT